MFYSDVIDMLCLYIQQSLFDLLQNSINELLLIIITRNESYRQRKVLQDTSESFREQIGQCTIGVFVPAARIGPGTRTFMV